MSLSIEGGEGGSGVTPALCLDETGVVVKTGVVDTQGQLKHLTGNRTRMFWF